MEKTISVSILGREYTLRVEDKDEALTREIATYVHSRLAAYKQSLRGQPEGTVMVLTCLAIAEELFESRKQIKQERDFVEGTAREIDGLLDTVLS